MFPKHFKIHCHRLFKVALAVMDRLGNLSSGGQFFMDFFLLTRAACFTREFVILNYPIYNHSHPTAMLLIMYSISVPLNSLLNAISEP